MTENLRRIADRLAEIAGALGDDDLQDERAIELAQEASRLTEEAARAAESEVAGAEGDE